MKKIHEVAAVYNQFGRAYHASRKSGGRFYNEFLELPAALSFIPQDLKDRNVLDAGCGSGFYAREMASRGATVVGIDFSETMIAIAKEENPTDFNIDYRVGDICETTLPDNSMDLILCNYVLENVTDIKKAFKEFYRVLKNKGECVYSVSHPLRAAVSKKEKVNDHEVWQLENYFDNTARLSDFGGGMKVKKFKHTISDYINSSIAAGFTIEALEEPKPIKAGQQIDVNSYELSLRLPQLLMVKMCK